MTATGLIRTSSGSLAFGRKAGGETQVPTVRWRDKRAQGALRSGGCFYWGIRDQTHIALQICNVHRELKPLVSLMFSHIAGLRHGR